MSNALNITSIEHNPEQSKLLINYIISEGGVWTIYPGYCGYRDFLNDYWTLIVPDTNDSRHTAFPVTVAAGGIYVGTFVWNYGSFRGIGPENFNSNKSYYIQLTIFQVVGGEVIDPPTSEEPPIPILVGNVSYPNEPERKDPDPPPLPPTPTRPPLVPGTLPRPRPPEGGGGGGGDDRPRIPTTGPITPGGNGGIGPIIPEEPSLAQPKPRPEDPIPPVPPVYTGPRGPVVLGPKPRPPEPPRGPFTPDRALIPRPQPGGIGPARPGDDQGIPVDPYPGGIGPGDVGLGNPMDPYPGGEGPIVPGDVLADPQEPNVLALDPYLGTLLLPGGLVVTTIPGDGSPYPGDTQFEPEDPGDRNLSDDPSVTNPGTINPEIPDLGGANGDQPYIPGEVRPKVTTDTSIIIQEPNDQQNPGSISRPSMTTIEGNINPNSFRSVAGRTEATSVKPGDSPTNIANKKDIDRTALQSSNGIDEGYLSKYNYKEKAKERIARRYTVTKIDAKHFLSGAIISLEVPVDDVPKGNKIFVSAALTVSKGISLDSTLELWIIDSQGRSILLDLTDSSLVSNSAPLTLGYSIASHNFTPGPMTIVVLARDKHEKVIAASSRKVIIRPTLAKLGFDSDTRIRESRNFTTNAALPAIIVDQAKLGRAPITFYVKDGKTIKILLNKIEKSSNELSAILVGSGSNDTKKYRMDLFSMTEIEPTVEGIPVIDLNTKYAAKKVIKNLKLASSTDRIKIDGEEIYPLSHLAAITNFNISDKQLLLCIAPDPISDPVGNRKFDLYLGSSYDIKGFTVEIIGVSTPRHTIRGTCPYVMEKLGLIIHGKDPNSIPENYAIQYANTDEQGNFNWPGVFIESGDYYSIILSRYDQFNAYNGIVYSARI